MRGAADDAPFGAAFFSTRRIGSCTVSRLLLESTILPSKRTQMSPIHWRWALIVGLMLCFT
ncbi:MAG: hypothetical protein WAN01_17915, partial [Bradyrhizobium sp.]